MMTTEDWMTPLFQSIKSDSIDMSMPAVIQAYIHKAFFGVFMVVGGLFMINLFVGVIIDNFNKIKSDHEVGGAFVTPKQRKWL